MSLRLGLRGVGGRSRSLSLSGIAVRLADRRVCSSRDRRRNRARRRRYCMPLGRSVSQGCCVLFGFVQFEHIGSW